MLFDHPKKTDKWHKWPHIYSFPEKKSFWDVLTGLLYLLKY